MLTRPCDLLPYLTGTERLETLREMLRSCLGVRVVHTIGSTKTRRQIERQFLFERIAEVAGTLVGAGEKGCAVKLASAINDIAVWWP